MRKLMVLIAIAGCRIPDETFTSGDAVPPGDAVLDTAPGLDAPADAALGPLAQRAYVKASNTGQNDTFGNCMALSADGSTLAVGASGESSGTASETDNSSQQAGAVYIFTRTAGTWTQRAYLKASNPETGDMFGASVGLSADGSTLTVGAPSEDSAAAGINGNQGDNMALGAGAVYVFTRAGTSWAQQAYIKASNPGVGDAFGVSLALSGDGATLAVGANQEDSSGFGNQTDNSLSQAGAAYVFVRTGSTWNQQAYLKASNPGMRDQFGGAVALSGNGSTLAVGAYFESGGTTGVNGNQADRTQPVSGAVYVITRVGTTWTQQAYVKASNTESGDLFGGAVALDGTGSTLAVSAYGESSSATGIDGDQASNAASGAGAVYVLTRAGTTWTQQAYVKASNSGASDSFGRTFVALSLDGSTLAAGAFFEDSAATGVGGDETNESASDAGAAYLFTRAGATWAQRSYVKSSNAEFADRFGDGGALSADGATLAVGAPLEDSASTGVAGNEADNAARDSGAVYLFQ